MGSGVKRLLEDLGSTVVGFAVLPEGGGEVSGVHIHDPLEGEPGLAPGALVLGVGLDGSAEEPVAALLAELARCGAAGLMVKAAAPPGEELRQAVAETGVALLGLTRAASWAQIAALVRSLLGEGETGGDESEADLFAVANAVCALLDAPVTIEDRSSRVLAYSGRQEEADEFRVETILGRRVPERFIRLYEEMGFFRTLYQSYEPVHLDVPGMLPRAAVAVRAGDEILGSMWAAVREPLTAQRAAAFADAAKIVALHLLRRRAGSDVQRRLRAELLTTVLTRGEQAAEAAARLDLATNRVCVLAAQLTAAGETLSARAESERQRFCDALALHVGAIHPRAAAALVGNVAYAVLPLPGGQSRAVQVAEDFLARVGARHPANIGIGRLARSLADITRSRDDADRALRVLRERGTTGKAVHFRDVHFDSLLLQLADLAAQQDQPPTGPYRRLLEHDREHNTDLCATLAAYLDAFGNVNEAAAAVRVHPNTFRYRLRRLTEISSLDLTDPNARLATMLQLRLYARPSPPRTPDEA
ncbi:DNA-binding PucR family transcriptional regulator [Actinocorallia herbida]|uniref:DNA-binding PucR family transcriptional regulator n=1 Tax=Actinocorallia herbida TaxID=58109 RepID=A0A3N1D867_9ACTN|nr:helix-turn-helix domain-containing protein [Actinocorallia herbida]ROO89722.1 DNA-binding PucR family transcriptional regulator [Actinocorallia herbida]